MTSKPSHSTQIRWKQNWHIFDLHLRSIKEKFSDLHQRLRELNAQEKEGKEASISSLSYISRKLTECEYLCFRVARMNQIFLWLTVCNRDSLESNQTLLRCMNEDQLDLWDLAEQFAHTQTASSDDKSIPQDDGNPVFNTEANHTSTDDSVLTYHHVHECFPVDKQLVGFSQQLCSLYEAFQSIFLTKRSNTTLTSFELQAIMYRVRSMHLINVEWIIQLGLERLIRSDRSTADALGGINDTLYEKLNQDVNLTMPRTKSSFLSLWTPTCSQGEETLKVSNVQRTQQSSLKPLQELLPTMYDSQSSPRDQTREACLTTCEEDIQNHFLSHPKNEGSYPSHHVSETRELDSPRLHQESIQEHRGSLERHQQATCNKLPELNECPGKKRKEDLFKGAEKYGIPHHSLGRSKSLLPCSPKGSKETFASKSYGVEKKLHDRQDLRTRPSPQISCEELRISQSQSSDMNKPHMAMRKNAHLKCSTDLLESSTCVSSRKISQNSLFKTSVANKSRSTSDALSMTQLGQQEFPKRIVFCHRNANMESTLEMFPMSIPDQSYSIKKNNFLDDFSAVPSFVLLRNEPNFYSDSQLPTSLVGLENDIGDQEKDVMVASWNKHRFHNPTLLELEEIIISSETQVHRQSFMEEKATLVCTSNLIEGKVDREKPQRSSSKDHLPTKYTSYCLPSPTYVSTKEEEEEAEKTNMTLPCIKTIQALILQHIETRDKTMSTFGIPSAKVKRNPRNSIRTLHYRQMYREILQDLEEERLRQAMITFASWTSTLTL